ncbi:MAG TPA: spore coat protein YsxE, partial [Bacillales bacterium]|nr:spore coat protein YsxE [Bacillales bacterium]
MSGNIGPILMQYHLYPNKVETLGKVRKIWTNRGVFALKETSMSTEQRTWFAHVVERLARMEFHQLVIPVPARSGQPFAVYDGKIYYLTPWVNDESYGILSAEERAVETAAALHLLTEKEQNYSVDTVEKS